MGRAPRGQRPEVARARARDPDPEAARRFIGEPKRSVAQRIERGVVREPVGDDHEREQRGQPPGEPAIARRAHRREGERRPNGPDMARPRSRASWIVASTAARAAHGATCANRPDTDRDSRSARSPASPASTGHQPLSHAPQPTAAGGDTNSAGTVGDGA